MNKLLVFYVTRSLIMLLNILIRIVLIYFGLKKDKASREIFYLTNGKFNFIDFCHKL